MLLKQSRDFCQKGLHNLKSIFFSGFQKLPKSLSFKPFIACASCNFRNHKTDQFYTDFYDELGSITHLQNMKEPIKVDQESPCEGSFMKFANSDQVKIRQRKGVLKEKKKMGSSHFGRANKSFSSQNLNTSQSHVLPKKMKELEKMDAGNLEHVLDIEEALHYYSRLKSPVYLDIVDNFFMDISTEFSNPQAASVRTNNSKRRFGSFRT